MFFKILGGVLILFGLVDFLTGIAGVDVWALLGVQLPEAIWSFSIYLEVAIGCLLFSLGSSDKRGREQEVA